MEYLFVRDSSKGTYGVEGGSRGGVSHSVGAL